MIFLMIFLINFLINFQKMIFVLDKQRQEQMNRLLAQIETNIEENILTESDCNDQLKNFLELRKKFNKDNEKQYNNLKFSNQIVVPEENPQTFESEGQDIEKFAKLISFNQELLTEKQRKRLFSLQRKVLRVLRKFVNEYRSIVKQKAQGNKPIYEENGENKIIRYEINRKEKKDKSIGKQEKSLNSFDRSYQKYYESLKKLKTRDSENFMGTITRLKNIKGKWHVSKYLKDL